jgi:hypothetical protein
MPEREPIFKYGLGFPSSWTPLQIEFHCIRAGGRWTQDGRQVGAGLFEHYRNAQRILWPEDDEHRWSNLALQTIVENEVTVMMGASDCGKTYSGSKFVLMDWWAFPEETLWMVSSTELRGAELRVWGTLKQLFNRARKLHPELPGSVLESKHCITTEMISDDNRKARLLTKGLVFIPCKSNGKWVGMGAYAGVKGGSLNARLGHFGDEVAAMQNSFLDAYSNWYGKENFKGIMSGNPFDLEDCLCRAAEPVDGWGSWKDTEKTQTWRSKFYDAFVVAFDGRDSPNLDFPETEPTKYKYLIGRKKLKAVAKTHGKDSWQWASQCTGKPRPGAMMRRVITRQLCEEFHAFEDVVWSGPATTKIAACDAAYGGVGGDDCILGHIEFGTDVDGNVIIACNPPVMVPVSITKKGLPEVQIAKFCKEYCETFDIPPSNFFFDARSTMAITFAKNWSAEVNVVDFGGVPTSRPVSLDTFIWDGDTDTKRLQLCNELYSKFVTELWYTIHYIVLSGQMRRLPQEVAEEGYKREWKYVKGNKIEVETKADMKLRTGHSPDRFDWLVTAVEGARRLGFEIKRMAAEKSVEENNLWLENAVRKHREFLKKSELRYV